MNIDTLAIAKELRAAELPAAQAEAIAAAIGHSVSETAATKLDLDLTKQELRADMERLHNRLLLWFIGTQVAVGGLVVALVKL